MFINMHDDMSLFYQDMEFVQGDLTDVVRAMAPSGSFKPSNDNIINASGTNFVGSNKFQDLGARDISMSPRQLNPVLAAPRMSAPRSHSVKRRKGQAKKVVCIPAPTPADQERNNSSSSSSVVVPSDHWAWRKYGQKPIKGSPYPRGYYRCSSSKGCLARKQVERSRSDPNMLIVTYTSEHNHPWPTHRNSLAGSTRSSSITKTSIHNNNNNNNHNHHPVSNNSNINTTPKVEEEPLIPNEGIKEESTTTTTTADFDRVFEQKYEPIMMLETNDMEFFSDLGGLDPNPMSFFMSSRDHVMGNINVEEELESKGNLDALSFFDNWDMHD